MMFFCFIYKKEEKQSKKTFFKKIKKNLKKVLTKQKKRGILLKSLEAIALKEAKVLV